MQSGVRCNLAVFLSVYGCVPEKGEGVVTEIRIKGTFITGSTVDDLEEAKGLSFDLLRERLKKVDLYESNDIFQFSLDSIEAEKI